MKGGSINMVDLDFEYKIWKNRLVLFENEIEILKNRNDEIKTLPGFAPLNSVELMVLDEHLDQLQNLLNLINGQENEFKFYNKDFPITREHQYFTEHEKLRKKMESISKVHLNRVEDLITALGI